METIIGDYMGSIPPFPTKHQTVPARSRSGAANPRSGIGGADCHESVCCEDSVHDVAW